MLLGSTWWTALPLWSQGVVFALVLLLAGLFFWRRSQRRSRMLEAQLRESEERWRRLVEEHPGPIYVTVDGHIKYINPSGARIFGAASPDELIGVSVHEFVHPDVRDLMAERLAQLNRGEPTERLEHRMIRRDGAERIVATQSVPVMYHGERAAQTVIQDVTEQRRTERALRESEALYRALTRSYPFGAIVVFDHDLRYMLAGGQGLEAVGLSADEMIGETIWEVFPPETCELIEPDYRAALAGHQVTNEVPYET
jgi:PAS domain S-box-containing protein